MMFARGIISLKYADDTIMFVDSDPKLATSLKWILTCVEQVSGMKINYDKSELIPMGLDTQEAGDLAEIFGCPVGAFPIKYLGVPLHDDRHSREDLQFLSDKILKRVVDWRGKLLSYTGRIILINHV